MRASELICLSLILGTMLIVLQNRMLDLKYSMQHLLARMLHKTNPKASLKAVDGMIQDVEA